MVEKDREERGKGNSTREPESEGKCERNKMELARWDGPDGGGPSLIKLDGIPVSQRPSLDLLR